MHADVHLHLHALTAAERQREAAASTASRIASRPTPASTTLRTQLGWKFVELGLRMATPDARRVSLTA